MAIHYLVGDATLPIHPNSVIAHVCNDIGAFGAGFVVSLTRLSPSIKNRYQQWYHRCDKKGLRQPLGAVQFLKLSNGLHIANMIAQRGLKSSNGRPPIRYGAVQEALRKVYNYALERDLVVSMPRIGSKLAGGDWATIEKIIQKEMTVETYVYTLPQEKSEWRNCDYEGVMEHDA